MINELMENKKWYYTQYNEQLMKKEDKVYGRD